MIAPKEEPLELSGSESAGVVAVPQSWTAYRDECVAVASKVDKIETPDELAYAVRVLQWGKEVIDRTTDIEEARRKPVNRWLKDIRKMRDDFLASVVKERDRITQLVNGYQRVQIRVVEEAEAKRQADLRKQQQESDAAAAEVERKKQALEKANTPKTQAAAESALLSAQLAAEETELPIAQPIVLAAPAPKGLATRVRFDFQVTNPALFFRSYPQFVQWKPDTETWKLMRQSILDAINSGDCARAGFPEHEGVPAGMGLRIFRDVSSHVR